VSLRPGIIGLGQVAWRFDEEPARTMVWSHAGAYRAAGYAPPIAYDPDPEARAAFAARFSDATVVDRLDLLVGAAPDVVSICSPKDWHGKNLTAALVGAPRAVWCEKPLARELSEAKAMVAACGERLVPLVVSHVRRWAPAWRRFKEYLDQGAIGRLYSLRIAMPNRLWSVGSHAVDLLLWLGGPVEDLHWLDVAALEEGAEPARAALFAFTSGAVGHLQVTGPKENLIVEAEAIGSLGRLRLSEADNLVRRETFTASPRYSGYRELEEVDAGAPDNDLSTSPFVAIAEELKALVADPARIPTCSGADALETQLILMQMAEGPKSMSKAWE